MANNAPIALFVFNRPDHTRRLLASLLANPGFNESDLFVFCDGPRNEQDRELVLQTRAIIQALNLPKAHVIERDKNCGLARSIIEGVTSLCRSYGSVIVLEDDLVLGPEFLTYMNRALQLYGDTESVMQISGHMFPVQLPVDEDALFLPFTSSWGWATWERAWTCFDPETTRLNELKTNLRLRHQFNLEGAYPYYQMLKKQSKGRIDSWAIRWYLSVFFRRGLTLYPANTLVYNGGFDGSGTHCGTQSINSTKENIDLDSKISRFPVPEINQDGYRSVKNYLWSQNNPIQRIKRTINKYIQ